MQSKTHIDDETVKLLREDNSLGSHKTESGSQYSESDCETQSNSESVPVWTRSQKLRLCTVLLAQFMGISGYAMISPFFPNEAMKKGLNEFIIGLIFASFQGANFIMSPVYGTYITKLRPKFMCVAGAFLCGGCCLLFGLLNYINDATTFAALCFLIRIVEGNGAAMLTVASASLLIKTFPDSTSTITSIIEMFVGFGYIIGPSLGGALYGVGGYPLPFLVVGSMTVLMSFLIQFVVPDLEESEAQSKNFLQFLRKPGLFIMFLHTIIASTVITYIDPVFSDWAFKTFNMGPTTVGWLFSGWSATYALGCPLIGLLAQRGYLYSTTLIGLLLSTLAWLLLAPSPLFDSISHGKHSTPFLVVICLVQGVLGSAIFVPNYQMTINVALLRGYDASLVTYGMVAGMIGAGVSLGSCLGPILAGLLTQKFGFGWSTTILAFSLAVMALVHILYMISQKCQGRSLAPETKPEKEEEKQSLLINSD